MKKTKIVTFVMGALAVIFLSLALVFIPYALQGAKVKTDVVITNIEGTDYGPAYVDFEINVTTNRRLKFEYIISLKNTQTNNSMDTHKKSLNLDKVNNYKHNINDNYFNLNGNFDIGAYMAELRITKLQVSFVAKDCLGYCSAIIGIFFMGFTIYGLIDIKKEKKGY